MTQSTFEKVVEICLPELGHLEMAVLRRIYSEKEYRNEMSLSSAALKVALTQALEVEETRNKVNELVVETPLEFPHLHFLSSHQELFENALKNSISKFTGGLMIKIIGSTCMLMSKTRLIFECPIGVDCSNVIHYANFAFSNSFSFFFLAVAEAPNGIETREELLTRIVANLQANQNFAPGTCCFDCYSQNGIPRCVGAGIFFHANTNHACRNSEEFRFSGRNQNREQLVIVQPDQREPIARMGEWNADEHERGHNLRLARAVRHARTPREERLIRRNARRDH